VPAACQQRASSVPAAVVVVLLLSLLLLLGSCVVVQWVFWNFGFWVVMAHCVLVQVDPHLVCCNQRTHACRHVEW